MRVSWQRLAVSSGRCLNHELHEPRMHTCSGERLHLWSCMHHYVSGHSRYLSWRFLPYDMYPYERAIVRPMQWNISSKPCFQYLHFRILHGPLNMYHLYWFAQPQGHSLRQIILSHPNCAWHSCGPNSKAFSSCRAWQASVMHWRTKRKSSHIGLKTDMGLSEKRMPLNPLVQSKHHHFINMPF